MPNLVARFPLHPQFIFISESPDIAAIHGPPSVPDVGPFKHQELPVIDKLTDRVLPRSATVHPGNREFKRRAERYGPSAGSILSEIQADFIPTVKRGEVCSAGGKLYVLRQRLNPVEPPAPYRVIDRC